MAAALSVESLRPDVDLKYSEQSAIEHVVHAGDFVSRAGLSTYTDGYAKIPQRWINAYLGPRHADGRRRVRGKISGNSVIEGDLLLHFAGNGLTKRERMTTFMDMLSSNSGAWEKELVKTKYPTEIAKFWAALTQENGKPESELSDMGANDDVR
ncbi:MAG: hypothetical protein Q9170_005354 [Blastenia crenularia]